MQNLNYLLTRFNFRQCTSGSGVSAIRLQGNVARRIKFTYPNRVKKYPPNINYALGVIALSITPPIGLHRTRQREIICFYRCALQEYFIQTLIIPPDVNTF